MLTTTLTRARRKVISVTQPSLQSVARLPRGFCFPLLLLFRSGVEFKWHLLPVTLPQQYTTTTHLHYTSISHQHYQQGFVSNNTTQSISQCNSPIPTPIKNSRSHPPSLVESRPLSTPVSHIVCGIE